MPDLYIGVHRSEAPPFGPAIDVMTRLALPGPYTFDAGPSTHAFVVFRLTPQGRLLRIDAEQPKPVCSYYVRPTIPTRLWQLCLPDADLRKGVAEAIATMRAHYDNTQLLAQAVAPIIRRFNLPHPPVYRGISKRGLICTEAACRTLEACGGDAAEVARLVMEDDHYPEELAHALDAESRDPAGSGWLNMVPAGDPG